jgi:hypothetical protein
MLRRLVVALVLVPAGAFAQDGAGGGERVVLSDRAELRGLTTGLDEAGALRFDDPASGRTLRLSPEEILRIEFPGETPPPGPRADTVRLSAGGMLSGRIAGADGASITLEHGTGTLKIPRAQARWLLFAPLAGSLPEIRDDPFDVLVTEEGGRDPQAEYGRLKSVGAGVVFASMAGEERTFDRAVVRQVLIRGGDAGQDAAGGWFAKVLFRNGDRVLGMLRTLTKDRIGVWAPAFGLIEAEKRLVASVSFVPQARLSMTHVLVCDQAGVRKLDRSGQEVWSYGANAQYAWSARRLDNGNVLVANTNFNQVLEIKPKGRAGADVVWRLDHAEYPYDAVRLENGNTLVAEYAANRIVEYDARSKAAAKRFSVNHPVSIQRLDNGHTLVSSAFEVVELDAQGQVKWRLAAAGVRPYRATRLENGNTLVVDQLRGQVVEFDAASRPVWRHTGLARPVEAIRLEDGNTLILEQGNNRIIEIDPANPKKPVAEIKGLQYPQGMSLY